MASLRKFELQLSRLEALAEGLPMSPRRVRQHHSDTLASPAALSHHHPAAAPADATRVEQLEVEVTALRSQVAGLETTVSRLLKLLRVDDTMLQIAEVTGGRGLGATPPVPHASSGGGGGLTLDDLRAITGVPPPHPSAVPSSPLTPAAGGGPAPAGLASPVRQQRVAAVIGADVSESAAGVKVVDISPKGPAYIAGIVPGDILLSMDGHAITCRADLRGLLASHSPGTILPVAVLRAGQQVTLQTVLGSAPARPWTPGASRASNASAVRSPNAGVRSPSSSRRTASPWRGA